MNNPFFNKFEGRLRALIRLALQVTLMFALIPLLQQAEAIFLPAVFGTELAKNILSFDCTQFIVVFLSMAGSIFLVSKLADRRALTSIGLGKFRASIPEYVYGFALALLLVGSMLLIELSLGFAQIREINFSKLNDTRFVLGLLDGLLACAMIGFHEELLRFYQIRNIGEGLSGFSKIGPRNALIIGTLLASAFFGYLHNANNGVTPQAILLLFVDGLFLSLAYLLTGRAWLAFGFHAGWDFAEGNVFGFPVSGYPEKYTLLNISQNGPDLVTGGAFGPDGGLINIVMILFGTIGILCWIYKREKRLRINNNLAHYGTASGDGASPET